MEYRKLGITGYYGDYKAKCPFSVPVIKNMKYATELLT